MIIIMRFGESNVLGPKFIDIYEFRGDGGRTYSTVHFLFIIQINGKSTRLNTYTKIIFYIILIFFSRMNNKKITKRGPNRGPTPISLRIEYSSSN